MLISWNWLNRHIDLSGLDPKTVGEQFTLKVAELDEVYEVGGDLDGVFTARVMSVEPHTDAKKLSIVEIFDGEVRHQLICGAPNASSAVGNVVAWVKPGSVLPNGTEIKVAEIRGVMSNGMLASELELNLSDANEGILILPSTTVIGVPIAEAIPIHDWIWEVDNKAITHRADLWGHRGIAREVSMLTQRPLLPMETEFEFGSSQPIDLDQNLPVGCLRYLSTRIDDVVVEPSPIWLQRLLIATGVRPISNIVDLTNYVMLDTGNPMHAFDSAQLSGGKLSVQTVKTSTSVTTLDEQSREVKAGALLICDGDGPVAVAGVMGCQNSQINSETTSLVLESACFNAESVRQTSIALGLRTESSARFEKALSPEMSRLAAISFCKMLKQLIPNCQFNYALLDAYPSPLVEKSINLSVDYASQRLGVALDSERAVTIFNALGLESKISNGVMTVNVPYWRAGRDLNHKDDLVEELGRSIGYYAIEPVSPTVQVSKPVRRLSKRQERVARRLMSLEGGYHEILSYAFAHAPTLQKLGGNSLAGMELANPISSDWPRMRLSLIPNLLKIAVENRRYFNTVQLFEVGRVFEAVDAGVGAQPRRLGWLGVYEGPSRVPEGHLMAQRALVERFLGALNYSSLDVEGGVNHFDYEKQWLHPNRSITLMLGGIPVGYLGTLHPRVARSFAELGDNVWFGELDLERLGAPTESVRLFQPLPKYPAIPFDLSLEVPTSMRAAALLRLVREQLSDCEIFEGVELFSAFILDAERKSLSLRFNFRSPTRSLSDDEVNPLIDDLIIELETKHGIGLRKE